MKRILLSKCQRIHFVTNCIKLVIGRVYRKIQLSKYIKYNNFAVRQFKRLNYRFKILTVFSFTLVSVFCIYTIFNSINTINPNFQDVAIVAVETNSEKLDESFNAIQCYTEECKNSVEEQTEKFPRVMVIGFGKSGTRALMTAIFLHPFFQGPLREVNYFDRSEFDGNENIAWYLEKFPQLINSFSINIEKSPGYIIKKQVPSLLIRTLKYLKINSQSMKFIVIMRNPITRAISEYVEWGLERESKELPPLPSFDNMVLNPENCTEKPNFLEKSKYSDHIAYWLDYFHFRQFCFVDGSQFITNPYIEMKYLERCLLLENFYNAKQFVFNENKGFYCFERSPMEKLLCLPKSKGRPQPIISKQTNEYLEHLYMPYNTQLEVLTQRKYTWIK